MRGQIIRVNKDAVPPKEHIEEIMQVYDTCLGMCFIEDGKLRSMTVNETVSVDHMMQLLEATKDKAVVVWFGESEDAYSEDDVQPFMAMDNQMAVFLDAPFSDYSHPDNPDSKHSRSFFAFHEYFQPEVAASAELADNNLGKVLASMRGGAFKRKMDKELLKEGGSCIIFASTGEINQWVTNTTAVTADWGWTSDDFHEPQAEETVDTKPEPAKPASLMDKLNNILGSKAETKTEPKENNVKNLAQGGAPVSSVAENLKSTAASITPSPVMWSPKMEANYKTLSNKRKKELYFQRTGAPPPAGWQNDVEAIVLPKGNYKPSGMDALRVIASTEPIAQPKEDKRPPEEQFPDTASRLPVLSKASHGKLDDLMKDKTFKKYLDTSSVNVQDPESAAKIEKRCPNLEEQRGMKPGETVGWPLEAYEVLASECPKEAAILLLNRAGQMISMQRALTGLGVRLHKVNKELLELKTKYEPDSLSDEDKKTVSALRADISAAKTNTSVPAAPAAKASGERRRTL